MHLNIQAPSILLYTEPVDFRKSIDGLIEVISTSHEINLHENIFVFYNRDRTKVKILAWHKNGFVLLLKRLEHGHFFNRHGGLLTDLNAQQLSWLLAGLDWVKMSVWGELEYNDFT